MEIEDRVRYAKNTLDYKIYMIKCLFAISVSISVLSGCGIQNRTKTESIASCQETQDRMKESEYGGESAEED